MKNKNIDNPNFQKQENKLLKRILIITAILILLAGIITGSVFLIKRYNANKISVKTIKSYWQEYDYSSVYEAGKTYLQQDPYNNTVLTYYGYACLFLAVSQNDNFTANEYLDESINKIRLALYEASDSLKPQLEYMLGKAYFFKNTISNYYYADLAVKYLNLAKIHNYEADDINLRLGLSYAALGATMDSISAFTEALLVRESDTLLLSIAEQYYKAGETSVAEQYLNRIINNSSDDDIILKSKLTLAQMHTDQQKYEESLKEYDEILEKYNDSADAYYGRGVIYEKQNNMVKARAEWRKAIKLEPNHAGAKKKLSIY